MFIYYFLLSLLINFSQNNNEYDVVVYKASPAGIAASIQATRMGLKVALIEPHGQVGGMLVEGLGGSDIDNHSNFKNSSAVSGIALEFYKRIAKAYKREAEFEELLLSGQKNPDLWRFEPKVAQEVIQEWLDEYEIDVFLDHPLAENKGAVVKTGEEIKTIRTTNGSEFSGKVFIDASIEGDLLARVGITYVVGRENNDRHKETLNGIRAETTHAQFQVKVDPYIISGDSLSGVIPTIQDEPLGIPGQGDHRIQAFCFRMCLTRKEGNMVPFQQPANYNRANYEIYLRYLRAGGKLYEPFEKLPNGKTDLGAWHDLSHNLYGKNHDYPEASYSERNSILKEHRDFTQGLFYFLSNDPEVGKLDSELQKEWSSWGLAKDEFQDNDHWPRQFYVREGRRMVSDYVITEHHLKKKNPVRVSDPVTLAYWPPDVHSVRRIIKDGYAYNEGFVFGGDFWRPLPISYRAMIPKKEECVNLITPTCLSSSHVAYGAIRLEWTFMTLGQASAIMAFLKTEQEISIQDIEYKDLLAYLNKENIVLGLDE